MSRGNIEPEATSRLVLYTIEEPMETPLRNQPGGRAIL